MLMSENEEWINAVIVDLVGCKTDLRRRLTPLKQEDGSTREQHLEKMIAGKQWSCSDAAETAWSGPL